MDLDFIIKMMLFIQDNDLFEEIDWDGELKFYANCNDFFYWGCADSEPISNEDFKLLESSVNDSKGYHGILLYCARKRKLRPQGAYYKHLKEDKELFDACGTERTIDIANPQNQDGEYKYK